jgi:hypothetical protein
MCGRLNMERTREYRAQIRQVFPAGSKLTIGLWPNASGRTVQVFVRNGRDSGHNLQWGWAVNRAGSNQLRLRLPKEPVDVVQFVTKSINEAIWGKNNPGYKIVVD